MKITLKKVLLCGLGIVGALAFLLVFSVKFKVIGTPEMDVRPVLGNGSIWECISKTPFTEVFRFQSRWTDLKTAGDIGGYNNQCKVFAILGLIAVIGMFITSLLAMLPKTIKGSRKVMIPLFSAFLGIAFVATVAPIAALSLTDQNAVWTEANAIVNIIFMFVGILSYVAMLIVPGCVKEKTLVELGMK